MPGPIQDDLYFDLAGEELDVRLVTGGRSGLALQLDLPGSHHDLHGDELEVKKTGIGTLVTGVLEQVPGSPQTDFSLLIPDLVVDPRFNNPQEVEVLALRTRHGDIPPGPIEPHGVFQGHTVFELSGNVTWIKPAPPMPGQGWSVDTSNRTAGVNDLVVTGTFQVPGPGYRSWLRRASRQDRPGKELRLQLTIYEPTEPMPEAPTTLDASYREIGCNWYDTVTIVPDGPSIPVEYEEVPVTFWPECDHWTATLDPPPDPDELVVNVEATCPPGANTELRPAPSQGDNPTELILEEVPDSTASTPTRLRYRRRTSVAYTRVVILPAGPCLPVTRYRDSSGG
jgi:hypothetical protein